MPQMTWMSNLRQCAFHPKLLSVCESIHAGAIVCLWRTSGTRYCRTALRRISGEEVLKKFAVTGDRSAATVGRSVAVSPGQSGLERSSRRSGVQLTPGACPTDKWDLRPCVQNLAVMVVSGSQPGRPASGPACYPESPPTTLCDSMGIGGDRKPAWGGWRKVLIGC